MEWLNDVYAHQIIDAKEGGAESVLVLLDGEQIFNVTPAENGLVFEESCDNNFRCTLTPAAVRQLCRELEALAEAIEAKRTAAIPPDKAAG